MKGYAGKFLRVDLSSGEITEAVFDEATLRGYIGGTGLGVKILYDETPPGVGWSDPENRLILASGPLGGSRIGGSGSYSVVTKGPLTEGATSTQANGFFGSFLRFSGFDGIILQGAASDWAYLYVADGKAELRDARHLLGKDTWQTEDAIKAELGYREATMSVVGIGPAGENLVRLAAIVGDKGHVAAHNGVGAVMGSKKLKAIAVARGKAGIDFSDPEGLSRVASQLFEVVKKSPVHDWGTLAFFMDYAVADGLPVKNYTTNYFLKGDARRQTFSKENIRSIGVAKSKPCWACRLNHIHHIKMPPGPCAGEVIEEPEYEGLAAWGPVTGNTDVQAAMVLADHVDKLGMDTNEAGWLIGLAMECYEKGFLDRGKTGGLEMTWGNFEATREMLSRVARREGLGDVLAEGVMRAAKALGAEGLGVYTRKGNSPRGHDHRLMWLELFDTAVSNTGTLETSRTMSRSQLGLSKLSNPFSPQEVAETVAKTKGAMEFWDSLVVCTFNHGQNLKLLVDGVRAATGWDFTVDEAMGMGRRCVNIMRLFNLRHGISPALDAPSPRYGSAPIDGPALGVSILTHWPDMVKNYYREMGWGEDGVPLPETLRGLGLETLVGDLPR
ncbi:MAG: hypothetical protein HYX92_20605 [Chloroflexi bacterium]|nr:hypothetical protein [Chloroflexota bacterium]